MKKRYSVFFLLCLFYLPGCAQKATIPNPELQIAAAVMAGPEEIRDNATVYGYNSKGELVLLREGTNAQICKSDDPNRTGFQTVCYHKDLAPFMNRGDELRAEGKTSGEIFDIREEEAKSGQLKMPEQPTTLHLLEGPDGKYDPETKEVTGAYYRYVVYIPWATAESTGLPTKPMVKGGPWIMDPGTHRAHIMISPRPED